MPKTKIKIELEIQGKVFKMSLDDLKELENAIAMITGNSKTIYIDPPYRYYPWPYYGDYWYKSNAGTFTLSAYTDSTGPDISKGGE